MIHGLKSSNVGIDDSVIPVTVIIPNFNSETYLDECIQSINTGQWPSEILIIDDCSTDNSLQLAKKLESEFFNVRVIQLLENGGAAAARKIGIIAAKCDWIAIVDADDYLETDAIPTAFAKAITEQSDMCIWQLWRFDANRAWQHINLDAMKFPKSGRQAVVDALGSWKIHPMGVSKKELYSAAYNHFNENFYNADELITRLVFAELKQLSLCEKRYFYRVNPNSTTQKKQLNRLTELQSMIWLLQFSKQYPEVAPGQVGSRAISAGWRVLRNRNYYGTKASVDALSEFVSNMNNTAELSKWLWRYPKHLAQYVAILLVCKWT